MDDVRDVTCDICPSNLRWAILRSRRGVPDGGAERVPRTSRPRFVGEHVIITHCAHGTAVGREKNDIDINIVRCD